MAVGTGHDVGVMAPADVAGAGSFEWATTAGVPPTNPLVGGPNWSDAGFGVDPDRGRGRIVTTPQGNAGPASTPGTMVVDTWRDVLNFQGSPTPWVLVGAVVVLGFMQFRVQARLGRAKASAALG